MDAQQREFAFSRKDFNYLREIVTQHAGIVLKDDKFTMLYARLSRRIRVLGMQNFRQYCAYLEDNREAEITELVNAVTTNLTSFFREKHHFEYLANTLIPAILARSSQGRRIRIWSAGCSTGEEPYSIAMTLKQASIPPGWDVKILATDIDLNVLAHADKGVYTAKLLDGIPLATRRQWFQCGQGDNEDKVRVAQELRDTISFRPLNLLRDWPFSGPFDAIFCRNVVIYFDKSTKKALVERFEKYMHEESCLFLGHSESLFRVTDVFRPIGNTIFQKEKDATRT